ncbi:MAG: metal ABC transporter substrate-binding protein [Oscillospiraceae bacterium]
MKKILAAVLALCLFAGALAACAATAASPAAGSVSQAPAAQSAAEAQSLSVVSTIFPYYDFARAIAGSEENLHMLLKPGSESHSYEPSAADILTIQAADIFVYTGGHTDDWVDKILEAVDNPDLVVVRMMDYVSTMEEELVEGMQDEEHTHEEGEEEEEEHGLEERETDEHIWTSPINAIALVNALCDAFAAKNAGGAEAYRQNAEAYTQQLAALDGEFRTVVQNASSKLLVFGDRFPFRYFTEEYGLSYYAAFAGCSTDSNASAGTIAFLVDVVRSKSVPYIFKIELSSGSIAKTISEEAGCEVLLLESCHNVTPAQFAAGETYLSLMRQNAETLKTALA